MNNRELKLAAEIRTRCIKATKEGFRDASMSELCPDGAMEAVISAIQKLDLNNVIESHRTT